MLRACSPEKAFIHLHNADMSEEDFDNFIADVRKHAAISIMYDAGSRLYTPGIMVYEMPKE
jgi:hypothetical protein